MRVLHEGEPLATEVELADSLVAKLRGLMLRPSVPEGYAMVFRFGSARRRDVNMLFMRTPIDVLWVADGRVVRRETLRPWRGFGIARADTIVELAPGAAADVGEGDRVTLAASD